MDLKNYISNVIISISEAIEESQDQLKDSDTVVVPYKVRPGISGKSDLYEFDGQNTTRPLQEIEFDISVSIDTAKESEGKGAIKVVGLFDIGGGNKNANQIQEHNRIKFKIPIAFSRQKK
ncbi:MAG: hypothetical protein MJA30_11305 [Cytophagales bacterium]|nr:hypothetical protein [Cytophagales bacterium]